MFIQYETKIEIAHDYDEIDDDDDVFEWFKWNNKKNFVTIVSSFRFIYMRNK